MRRCTHALCALSSFWVCEKSDGQRVLVLIAINKATGRQEVFLVSRALFTVTSGLY